MGPLHVFKTLTGDDMLNAPTGDDGSILVELDMKMTPEQWRAIEDRYRKHFSVEHKRLASTYAIHLTYLSLCLYKILLFLSKWFDFGNGVPCKMPGWISKYICHLSSSRDESARGRFRRKAVSDPSKRWPGKTIPYTIHATFGKSSVLCVSGHICVIHRGLFPAAVWPYDKLMFRALYER